MASEPLEQSELHPSVTWLRNNSARLLKFGGVGLSGVVVNLAIFTLAFQVSLPWLLGEHADLRLGGLHLTVGFILANFAGFVVSVFTNFLLNDAWTWGDRNKGGIQHWFRRLIKYYLTASGAGAVQILTASITLALLWAPMAPAVAGHELAPPLSVLTGIAFGMIINFTASHLWAFRDVRPPTRV